MAQSPPGGQQNTACISSLVSDNLLYQRDSLISLYPAHSTFFLRHSGLSPEDERRKEEQITKQSLCGHAQVLSDWAMGQRAVKPKLHLQYIIPLESNQLSVIGS